MSPDRGSIVLDLNGLLSIALVDAGRREIDAVRRQLGPLPAAAADVDSADIAIRFEDRLDLGPLRPLGREAAWTDEAFVVLRGRRKTSVRVQIPVDRIGRGRLELVAERGLPAVPFLLPIVNLTLLSKGVVPVHASAFTAGGRGTLVTGWAKGGKTEVLLSFADHGATYVGDEWVFVTADGRRMAGLPEPMRVWDWQLAQVPRLRDRIGLARRVRLGAAATAARTLTAVGRLPAVGRSAPGDAARRLGAIAENQRSLQVPPERVFDGRVAVGLTPLDRVILIESTMDPDPLVAPIESSLVAKRTASTIVHELLDLEALYRTFRYAFPERPNPFIESLPATLEERLTAAFLETPCLLVRHPYPPDIPALRGLIDAPADAREVP